LEVDDWLIAASLVPLVGLLATAMLCMCGSHSLRLSGAFTYTIDLGGENGLGKHVWGLLIEDLVLLRKVRDPSAIYLVQRLILDQLLFAYLLIYLTELLLIKVSILMFYRRIFGMNWSIWTCLFISYGWALGSMIATICVSDPVSYFWTQGANTDPGKYRFNFYNYLIGNATANVVSDALILLVPMPIVWSLRMPALQKVGVCSVLLLGVV
jgi:hypothetical protein